MFKFLVILALLGVVLGLPINSTTHGVSPRITGGEETNISRNPWQLALLYYGQHFCGAVAIHSDWALTAAHCLSDALVEHLSIRAGSTTKSFGGQVIDVVRKHVHPQFDSRTVDYDFALLELAEPITIQTAAFIAFPEPHQDIPPGSNAIITGWGTLNSSEPTAPEILHKVEVPVVDRESCQRAHPLHRITDRMFCAGVLPDGGRDACRGDGGGPVVVDGRLAGLVSWGRGCGQRHIPGVNAKVGSVIDWIYQASGI